MAELAHAGPLKEQRGDAAHDAALDAHDGADPLQVDGKASDAAVRRMMQGAHDVGGTTDGKTAAKAPASGDSGMLTAEQHVKLDGKDVTLPKGTVVVVDSVKGDSVTCKVWSGFGGKAATVPLASFKAEPALSHKEENGHTSEPQDFTYQPYDNVLWDGAPKATDVAQGYLGDCYLMAAMGAVAAANPKAIKDLFSPQTPGSPTYTVSLYVREGFGGKFAKHSVTVDTNLPTRIQDVQRHTPIYALMGQDLADKKHPMWPALLEKAYAQLMGGYDVIGEGGPPERAMEALTGVASQSESIPAKEADVVTRFKEYQKAGKAVVCGTLDSKQAKSQGGFAGAGEGPFAATLDTDQGEAAEIVKGTLAVYDKEGKAPRAHDDSDGKLVGTGVSGEVEYDAGHVSAKYDKAKAPGKAGDLQADYSWRGLLDKGLNLHAWHAYIFESVTADNKLVFKNPWGVEHPNPISAAQFKALFTGIDSNSVKPDQTRKPPKKKT